MLSCRKKSFIERTPSSNCSEIQAIALMIQNLANVAIFFYPGERVVQSQEDQVEEGGFLK